MCCGLATVVVIKIIRDLCFLFQKMDKNKDGVVTLEEFIRACQEVNIYFYICDYYYFLLNHKLPLDV